MFQISVYDLAWSLKYAICSVFVAKRKKRAWVRCHVRCHVRRPWPGSWGALSRFRPTDFVSDRRISRLMFPIDEFRDSCYRRSRWRSNPSGKCSHARLTRGTATSTMRRATRPSGRARCGAGAGCSVMKYQSIMLSTGSRRRRLRAKRETLDGV